MRGVHCRGDSTFLMADLARLSVCVIARDRRPDAALPARAVDRMTIDTDPLGGETKLLAPFARNGIMHGTLYILLVFVAFSAQVFSGTA